MHTPRALCSVLLFALAGSGVALAASELDQAANDPSYQIQELRCTSSSCKVFVMNDNGIGLEVEAMNRKWAEKKARKKADELNAGAEKTALSEAETGVIDVCEAFPEVC